MREYLADPEMAAAYLNVCIEDGNPWLIADAFRTVENIHGSKRKFRVEYKRLPIRASRPKPIMKTAPTKRSRRVAA